LEEGKPGDDKEPLGGDLRSISGMTPRVKKNQSGWDGKRPRKRIGGAKKETYDLVKDEGVWGKNCKSVLPQRGLRAGQGTGHPQKS